ncbi:MAG: apolipoprotein N-acyltransferase [Sandaracinaceae bacterium]|nr:apolipoprotein N-acyltransferase [Sandaracinaceae bacterium]
MASDRPAPAPTPPKPPLALRLRPWLILSISAVLMFLGFAGFGVWPLAFVGLVPALYVFDPVMKEHGGFARPTGRPFFWRAWYFGYASYVGGFYWVEYTIRTFGGFPLAVSSFFASAFWGFQGLEFALLVWLFRKARDNGWPATLVVVSAYLGVEGFFPMLFEHYYGNAFFDVPVLTQIADLGGPEMCTALAIVVNGAIYETLAARLTGKPLPRPAIAAAAGYVLFALGYGGYRLSSETAREASAETIRIASVQANLGLFERFDDPFEGVRRQRTMSDEVEATEHPDLLVWPESSVPVWLDNPRAFARFVPTLETPLLFGAIRHGEHGREHNTAFVTNADREIVDHYDKTYLLAFGEYIPFGDQFPVVYEISPMSGQFSPGDDVEPLPLELRDGRTYRASALICYEDIVSSFVRRAVNEGDPHVLLNISVDSWFGDTHEPWVHLALAQFRAIEHRRWLVRTTITGVSAFVDSTGRVRQHTGVFAPATLVGDVPMLSGTTTLYELAGPWPGWLGAIAIALMAWRRRELVPGDKPPDAASKPSGVVDKPSSDDEKPSARDDKPSARDDKPSTRDDKHAARDDKPSARQPNVDEETA